MGLIDRISGRRAWRERYARVSDDDLEVLHALVRLGADLDEPRHVLHHTSFPTGDAASAAADAAGAAGFEVEVRDPSWGISPDWCLLSQRHDYVLTPAAVEADRRFFERLAASHAGAYDGWEASVDRRGRA